MKIVKVIICAIVVSFLFNIASSVHAASLLNSLEVEGIGALDVSSRKTWNLSYSTSYDYVNINATGGEGVNIQGAGKVSLKEGANSIVITASNGSQSETYTINLNVTKKSGGTSAVDPKDGTTSNKYDKDATDIKNPETGAFVNFTLLSILAITSLVTMITFLRKKSFYNI